VKIYADTPVRRTRQIVADAWMALWVVVWVKIGVEVDDAVMKLAAPGRELAEAGTGLESGLQDAGDRVAGVPLVPDGVRTPFDRASDAGGSLRGAGEAQVEAVDTLATFLGVLIAVMPIVILLVIWLPIRVRFVRHVAGAQRFIDAAPDLDLFALRALARQPMPALARIHDDPAGAWRAKDPDVVRALASLELRESGLRTPPAAGAGRVPRDRRP
jgi:hypothetical protein